MEKGKMKKLVFFFNLENFFKFLFKDFNSGKDFEFNKNKE